MTNAAESDTEPSAAPAKCVKVPALGSHTALRRRLEELGCPLPCDPEILRAPESPLAAPLDTAAGVLVNRWCIHPMEGWDGDREGRPTDYTRRRWERFGRSGAALIWGGEAVAVTPDGRANPNQLMLLESTAGDLAALRVALIRAHQELFGARSAPCVGLQLTHSGRYSRPDPGPRGAPRILFHHPVLDRRVGAGPETPALTDEEIRSLIRAYCRAAELAWDAGFDFVDVKHCHGYLGHEFLGAHGRPGPYGGSFANRTRFFREVVEGIRARRPELPIGVRLSAFDTIPFRPDPARSAPGRPGPGIPEDCSGLTPYSYGFGVDEKDPVQPQLDDAIRFLELARSLDVRLVNLSAGSPYYNPHIQRPALYPPSDGYLPPEDPLAGCARQIRAAAELKSRFPGMTMVGTGYSYLQEYLPHVAQAVVREGWIDLVGIGRMVLAYPELPNDVLAHGRLETKRLCRTFSDCTTAPRNGMVSGCYPLDPFYRDSPLRPQLQALKQARRSPGVS